MSLHDACHSIDSPDIGPILEIVKFPKSSRAEKRHDRPLDFVLDRSAGEPGPSGARRSKAPSSQAVVRWSGDRRAGGRGLVWLGYWTVGQYLVSTDDAYVKAD